MMWKGLFLTTILILAAQFYYFGRTFPWYAFLQPAIHTNANETSTPLSIETSVAEQSVRNGTWTAYPSLLRTLPEEAHREALEDAVCFHHCGRYDEATANFDSRLPPTHTNLLLTFEKADMLESQGLRIEKIELLQKAIEHLPSSCNASEQILLRLMLATSKFFVFGYARQLESILTEVRSHMRDVNIQSLSDVEFRITTIYYLSTPILNRVSNFLSNDHRTALMDSTGNKSLELTAIRKNLQDQGRWQLYSMAARMELSYLRLEPREDNEDVLTESVCATKTLDSSVVPALRFQSVILRRFLADLLEEANPRVAGLLTRRYRSTLQSLSELAGFSPYVNFSLFAPALHFDSQLKGMGKPWASEIPEQTIIDIILEMTQEAQARRDITRAINAFIAARNTADAWLTRAKDTESEVGTRKSFREEVTARESLRKIQQDALQFQRNITRMVYLEAFCLSDLLHTLSHHYHDYETVLREVEGFERNHPDFEIPNVQTKLYSLAVTACEKLECGEKQATLEEKHRKWLAQSPPESQGGNSTNETDADPT